METNEESISEDLRQQVRDYIRDTGTTQIAFSRLCGISDSKLSGWINGKYPGDNSDIEKRARLVLEQHKSRKQMERYLPTQTVPTRCFNEIQNFCRVTEENRIMAACPGVAGCGKTVAAKCYVAENPSVIFLEADDGYTPDALMKDLCARLGIEARGTVHDKLLQVVDRLKGSGRLIIVDEAEHFNYKLLENLRRIHDKAGVGVALIGQPRFFEMINSGDNRFAQIVTRLRLLVKVGLANDAEIKAITDSRFSKVHPESYGVATKLSRHNLRVLSDSLFLWSAKIMVTNNLEELTPEVLRTAATMVPAAA